MASWKARAAGFADVWLRHFDVGLVRRSDLWRWSSQLGRQPQAHGISAVHPGGPFLRVFSAQSAPMRQEPFDFAVIMPTTLRPTITDALRSIFEQDLSGSVQTLIGVDWSDGDPLLIEDACRDVPANHSVLFMYPGYSTSTRHGGLHPAWDGGVLRTVLCYLANSRRLAFLDDDNWWAPQHLSSMRKALNGYDWAYARRWFVHPRSRVPICEDVWESIGPGQGIFAANGGWVDPNCLAFDKLACEAVLRWFSIPLRNSPKAMDADRNVLRILSTEFKGVATGETTVFYAVNEGDPEQPSRLDRIGHDRYRSLGLGSGPNSREIAWSGLFR